MEMLNAETRRTQRNAERSRENGEEKGGEEGLFAFGRSSAWLNAKTIRK